MKKFLFAKSAIVLSAITAVCAAGALLSGCGDGDARPSGSNTEFAYSVTDGGENTKIITVDKSPANSEPEWHIFSEDGELSDLSEYVRLDADGKTAELEFLKQFDRTLIISLLFGPCATEITVGYERFTPEYTLTEEAYTVTGCKERDIYQNSGVIIPDTYNEKPVTAIAEEAFYKTRYLTSVSIGDNVMKIGKSAFSECYDMTEINIPFGITEIEESAFSYCYSLTRLSLPESVRKIGSNAFRYCELLENIELPEGLVSIGSYALSYCVALKSVNLSVSLQSIGENAFYHHGGNFTVYYDGTNEQWSAVDKTDWENDINVICNG